MYILRTRASLEERGVYLIAEPNHYLNIPVPLHSPGVPPELRPRYRGLFLTLNAYSIGEVG